MTTKSSNLAARVGSSSPIIAAFCALSAALFFLAVVVAYYNVLYSIDRIAAIFRIGSGVDYAFQSERLPIPAWVMPFMQDLSVVSPALTAFTLLCISYGGFLLLRAVPVNRGRSPGPRFPFPSAYKGYYIQIGLIGTIVGFVIAFSNINPSLQGQSEVLLDALGTALWSTLTAITLAYVVCPLIEILFQGWLRVRTGYDANPDTLSAIEALRLRTVSATESLDDFARSISALSADMDRLQLKNRLNKLEQGLEELKLDIDSLKHEAKTQSQNVQFLNKRVTVVEDWESDWERKMDELIARIEHDRNLNAGVDQRLENLEKTVSNLLNQLKKALD